MPDMAKSESNKKRDHATGDDAMGRMAHCRPMNQEDEDEDMAGTLGTRGEPSSLSSLSKRVAEICREKGRTTYNEVADELVDEILGLGHHGGGRESSEEKNIRRRVYDAFNVLIAVGSIEKDGKKDVFWKGFGNGADGGRGELSAQLQAARLENARHQQAIERKQEELQGLLSSQKVVNHLIETNPVRSVNEENASDIALHIPFMLVRAKPEATVEVKVSDTMREVDFKFTGATFSLHDDAFVLRQMASNLAKNELSKASTGPACVASAASS